VGTNRGFEPAEDGSLDLVLSPTAPEGVPEANWLPGPEGEFKLLLRMYGRKPSVFEPAFSLEPVLRDPSSAPQGFRTHQGGKNLCNGSDRFALRPPTCDNRDMK